MMLAEEGEAQMLAKFEVENFKNFDGKYVLDLSHPNSYGFHSEAVSEETGCITKAVIYGPNGSGKSNLGLAIFDIVAHLTDLHINPQRYLPYSNLDSRKHSVEDYGLPGSTCPDFGKHDSG